MLKQYIINEKEFEEYEANTILQFLHLTGKLNENFTSLNTYLKEGNKQEFNTLDIFNNVVEEILVEEELNSDNEIIYHVDIIS